jgi:hypothetical protein
MDTQYMCMYILKSTCSFSSGKSPIVDLRHGMAYVSQPATF